MKITSRLGVLLAKIAGKEASLEHMVPPWATNAEEELMLDIADRIDQIEAGGSGGGGGNNVLIANYDNDTGALDKTWQQIYDALNSGTPAFIKGNNDGEVFMLNIKGANSTPDYYVADITEATYVAESANDYPVAD